ncbi:unnamed protein product, partial [Ilex paraguariensis]
GGALAQRAGIQIPKTPENHLALVPGYVLQHDQGTNITNTRIFTKLQVQWHEESGVQSHWKITWPWSVLEFEHDQ